MAKSQRGHIDNAYFKSLGLDEYTDHCECGTYNRITAPYRTFHHPNCIYFDREKEILYLDFLLSTLRQHEDKLYEKIIHEIKMEGNEDE